MPNKNHFLNPFLGHFQKSLLREALKIFFVVWIKSKMGGGFWAKSTFHVFFYLSVKNMSKNWKRTIKQW